MSKINNSNRALPNLIIIGAMKSGTSSLHDYLNIHPDIQMSNPKELDFFIDPDYEERKNQSKYEKGLEWYSNYFDDNFQIRGESSQNYSKVHKFKNTPKLIYEKLGNIKLIYILRDPIERLYSNISQQITNQGFTKELIDHLGDDANKWIENPIVGTSLYGFQLQKYLEYFDSSNIHIVFLEDLKNNRKAVLNKTFAFLGIKELEMENKFDFISNSSKEKVVASSIFKFLKKWSWFYEIRRILPKKIRVRIYESKKLKKVLFKPYHSAPENKSLTLKLKKILIKDVELFIQLSGVKNVPWKNFHNID